MDVMELCWETASCVQDIVLMCITGYLLYRFAKPFFGNGRYAKTVGITYFLTMLLLYVSYRKLRIDGPAADAVATAAVFAVMCFTDRRNINQKVFLAVIMYLIERISGSVESLILGILFHYMTDPPYIAARPVLQFLLYLVIMLADAVCSFLIMSCLFRIVDRAYTCKWENMNRKELGLILATPFSVIAGSAMFRFYSNVYLSDSEQYIWNVHPEYEWIRALYHLISFAAIMATIVIYQNIKDSNRKEKENALLYEQVESAKRHVKEIERLYQDVRSLRHDMGNHVATLEHLFLQNEPQETENYLRRWKEQLNEITPELNSGNPVTDAILMERQKEAKEKGIRFFCDFHYPLGTQTDAFDISVILNNALDNALEGALKSETPYVGITSGRNKNAYMIEIKNSFDGKLIINEENGLPETTKDDRRNHGYGMVNIKKMAQKYFGDIEIRQDGKDVVLIIMLILP